MSKVRTMHTIAQCNTFELLHIDENFGFNAVNLLRHQQYDIEYYSTGVALSVSMRGYQIDIALTMTDEFHNVTLSGLFGNFNGYPLDDLVSANGETLDASSSEELIYQSFGETCKLIFSLSSNVQIVHSEMAITEVIVKTVPASTLNIHLQLTGRICLK